jgi:hypothetical protein
VSPTETRNGAPRQRPAREQPTNITRAVTTTPSTSQSNDLLRVWSTSYPPAFRRHRWLHVVDCCPGCGCAHVHFGSAGGGARRAGCGQLEYQIVPRHKLGAVVA